MSDAENKSSLDESETHAEARAEAVQRIVAELLKWMSERNDKLPYHNRDHVDWVMQVANWLAGEMNFSATEKQLVVISAAGHDLIMDHNPMEKPGLNETDSGKMTSGKMTPDHFNEEERRAVQEAISATFTTWDSEEGRLKQNLPEQTDAQQLSARLAQVLCDADLGALGSDFEIYWSNMARLYKERFPQPGMETWEQYLRSQLPILKNHRYYTEAAKKRFNHLEENAQRVEEILGNPEEIQRTFEELPK